MMQCKNRPIKKLVVIVDDIDEIREAMKKRLLQAGFEHVIAYSSAAEVLSEVNYHRLRRR
jgi:FixJ family two-component response regulator